MDSNEARPPGLKALEALILRVRADVETLCTNALGAAKAYNEVEELGKLSDARVLANHLAQLSGKVAALEDRLAGAEVWKATHRHVSTNMANAQVAVVGRAELYGRGFVVMYKDETGLAHCELASEFDKNFVALS